MTFGQSYLTHMKCLENVGLLRTDAIYLTTKSCLSICWKPCFRSCKPWSTLQLEKPISVVSLSVKDGVERLATSTMFATIRSATQRLDFTGYLLHNRCSCHDWDKISDGWYLETTGVITWRVGSRPIHEALNKYSCMEFVVENPWKWWTNEARTSYQHLLISLT